MPRRDLFDDTPGLQLVGDLAPGPLTDGAPYLLWRFTGEGGHLAPLFSGELGWSSWAGRIL